MLSSRVSVPQPLDPTQEDIFSSSLSNLFTDDTQNSHGTPGQAVTYHSPCHGEIKLGIPQHPDVEEGRKLFAHYLWNAGVVAADAIERASCEDEVDPSIQEQGQMIWDRRYWDMKEQDVLELGAGTALPSLIAAKSGANSITITDHPSSPALVTGTISQNVRDNLSPSSTTTPSTAPPNITITGLTWGDPFFTSSTTYGKLASPQPAQNSFHKIIIADCLWMPSQHRNIVKTINTWLRTENNDNTPKISPSPDPKSTSNPASNPSIPCALVIAGFHTGRATVSSFFEIATGADKSNEHTEHNAKNADNGDDRSLSIAQIIEVDVNLNVREWVSEREGENKEQLKRWCVVAVLVRRGQGREKTT